MEKYVLNLEREQRKVSSIKRFNGEYIRGPPFDDGSLDFKELGSKICILENHLNILLLGSFSVILNIIKMVVFVFFICKNWQKSDEG